MKVTLLGTGTSQGVPVVGCQCAVCQSADPRDTRLRTAAYVEVDGTHILIDTGPDLRQQMLHNHLGGLDDIRPIYFMKRAPMEIYGLQRVLNVVRKDYDYAFKPHPYPGVPSLHLNPVKDDPFEVNGITIQPIHVRHLTLPILGYRIGPFAYITDASFIPETELNKLTGIKVLVINALRIKEHYSHFNLAQALGIVERLQLEQAYITHISHEMGRYADVAEMLPNNVFLGIDGLVIEVE